MLIVERNLRKFAAEVTNGSVYGLNRELAELASADHSTFAVELGALNLEANHLAVFA